jgi:hypothetical protein
VFASNGLSARAQRSALAALTAASRLRVHRRDAPLPPLGQQDHLTAVLRLGASAVPEIDAAEHHYVYPRETVHVTVSNLDQAGAALDVAIARLSQLPLPAPSFAVGKLGCSSDTLFLRCIHDHRFDRLREAVELAFEVPNSRSPLSWLFRRLSFANVVRFDGPGEWASVPNVERHVRCPTLEIVRTDRYLSLSGTSLIQAIPLQNDA